MVDRLGKRLQRRLQPWQRVASSGKHGLRTQMLQCRHARNHPPEPMLNSLAHVGACSAMQSRVKHGMDNW
eukprot:3065931-Lingulodinium_polyedra.AAC.1